MRRILGRAAGIAILMLSSLTLPVNAEAEPNSPDPLAFGPYLTVAQEYHFGTEPFGMPGREPLDVQIRGVLHYPLGAVGRMPVVVLLHGINVQCGQRVLEEDLPGPPHFLPEVIGGVDFPFESLLSEVTNCDDSDVPGRQPHPSHRGYDYLGAYLASHGFVVASPLVREINDYDDQRPDGPWMRGQVMLRTLEHLQRLDAQRTPSFEALYHRIDFQRVGLMGHSRGGGGALAAHWLNAERPVEQRFGIDALVALAPTASPFERTPAAIDVPFLALLPYCDGDVATLDGLSWFEHSRYAPEERPSVKVAVTVMGANHNYYNTKWGDERHGLVPMGDDATHLNPAFPFYVSPHCALHGDLGGQAMGGRLSAEEQRNSGLLYIGGFFRWTLSRETSFAPFFNGEKAPPAPACPGHEGPCPDTVHVSFHAPATHRLVLEDARGHDAFTRNLLGGAVVAEGLTRAGYCHAIQFDVFRGSVDCPWPITIGSARQMVVAWDGPAQVRSQVPPAHSDVSNFDVLSLRASVSIYQRENAFGNAQELSIRLEDMDGRSSTVPANEVSTALYYAPDANAALAPLLERPEAREAVRDSVRWFIDTFGFGAVPIPGKVVQNEVRIPLEAFRGVDLERIASVALVLDGTPAGVLQMTDLMFQDETSSPMPEAEAP